MTSPTEWRLVPEELDAFLSDKGHNALLRHAYHAHEDDWVELVMPWRETIVGDPSAGSMARGAIMALVDNAAGVAIWLKRGGFLPQVTLDLRTDFLRPTQRGAALICRCTCVRMTPTVAWSRGVAYERDPTDPACLVSASYALL